MAAVVAAALVVAVWAATVAWRHREERGAVALATLLMAAAWTALATLGGFTAEGADQLLVWRQLRQVGFVVFAPAFLLFCARYAEVDRLAGRRTVAGLGVVAALIAAGIATTHLHGLFYGVGEFRLVAGVPRADFERGPLFWVHILYAYVLVATGTVLVVRRAIRTRHLFRRQAAVVVAFALVPWASNVVAVATPSAVLVDPTVVTVPVAGALVAVGVYRYRVLDAAPVARGIVLDHIDDGVLVVDHDGSLVDYNRTMWRYLGPNPVGKPVRELRSDPLSEYLAAREGPGTVEASNLERRPDDADDEDDADDGDGGDGAVDSLSLLDATGETRTFDVRRSGMTDTTGAELAAVYLFRDVTKRREREAQLRRRNEELDRFAGVVSHDLRNPLAVADGYLDLARETGEANHFERVEGAHDRLDAIISDLLALARTDEPTVAPVRLAESVRGAWRHVDTASASLSLDVAEDVVVLADSARLDRLFENLVRNAVEHGGDDVTVTVEAGDDWFAVGDDGPGLPADLGEAAFDEGASGDGGTGIGLAIVRSVAEAHGWTVEVDEAATGARFVVRGVERRSSDEQ